MLFLILYIFGSYKGVIKREAVYKCTNKDYLPEAEPRVNDHFTCEAKPSKGKARINCRALNKPPYNFLYVINRNLLDAIILFIYAVCYKVNYITRIIITNC